MLVYVVEAEFLTSDEQHLDALTWVRDDVDRSVRATSDPYCVPSTNGGSSKSNTAAWTAAAPSINLVLHSIITKPHTMVASIHR